jgi:hypothetical protein
MSCLMSLVCFKLPKAEKAEAEKAESAKAG